MSEHEITSSCGVITYRFYCPVVVPTVWCETEEQRLRRENTELKFENIKLREEIEHLKDGGK